jgi:hypothetical protein
MDEPMTPRVDLEFWKELLAKSEVQSRLAVADELEEMAQSEELKKLDGPTVLKAIATLMRATYQAILDKAPPESFDLELGRVAGELSRRRKTEARVGKGDVEVSLQVPEKAKLAILRLPAETGLALLNSGELKVHWLLDQDKQKVEYGITFAAPGAAPEGERATFRVYRIGESEPLVPLDEQSERRVTMKITYAPLCPDCGGHSERLDGKVITTSPPQFEWRCLSCKKVFVRGEATKP